MNTSSKLNTSAKSVRVLLADDDTLVRAGIRAGIRAALIASGPVADRETRAYCRRHRVPEYASLRAFVAGLRTRC